MTWGKLKAWAWKNPQHDPVFWEGYSHAFEVATEALCSMQILVGTNGEAGPAHTGATIALGQARELVERIGARTKEWARAHGKPA